MYSNMEYIAKYYSIVLHSIKKNGKDKEKWFLALKEETLFEAAIAIKVNLNGLSTTSREHVLEHLGIIQSLLRYT